MTTPRAVAVLALAAFAASCSDLPLNVETPALAPAPSLSTSSASPGDILVYGAQEGAGQGDLYRVNLTTGEASLVWDFPVDPSRDANSPNALAFDAEHGRLYYSVSGEVGTGVSTVHFLDVEEPGSHTLVATVPGRVYNAEIADGAYYFVQNGTNDLAKLVLAEDGTAPGAPVPVCTGIHSGAGLYFGDIAIKDGVVYGSATVDNRNPVYFFTVDLASCATVFQRMAYTEKLQLAWGADGQLYGHGTESGTFFRVDPATGALTPIAGPAGFEAHFADLAPGFAPPPPPPPAPELTLLKSAGAASVAAGEKISFSITVGNAGTGTATGVTLSDPLPGGLGISWSISPLVTGCSITGTSPQLLNCSFGTLPPGGSRTVTVTSATTAASCKVYANTATASADGLAPVSDDASVTVACPPPPTGVCSGGVSKLVVKYIGSGPVPSLVQGQRRNPQTSAILPAQTMGVGANTLYTFAIQSLGGLFSPAANGRLANNFTLFIGTKAVGDIHTSCSQPIYPGMVVAGGLFEIVEVYSVNGGKIAPLP